MKLVKHLSCIGLPCIGCPLSKKSNPLPMVMMETNKQKKNKQTGNYDTTYQASQQKKHNSAHC